MVLSVSPLLGGIAAAADPLPPLANPIADGAVCDGAPSNNPFSDLSAESPATREVILCLVATELTAGTTRTTFTPGGEVTRRQMALFIKRLADLLNELETTPLTALPAYDNAPDYTDVVAEKPEFREAIGQLSQAGIVGGFPDRTFRPDEPVSRRQMAAFVNRLEDHLRGEPYSSTKDYFDDDEGDSGEANLNALAEAGIFQGDGQGNVFPGANISRRQMANILLRDAQVYFAADDIRSPFDQSFERLAVTPTAVATLPPSSGTDSTTPADDREYSVDGLTAGQQYRVTLVDPANIGQATGGDTIFAEDGSTGLAAAGTVTARIVKVNGTALAGGSMAQSVGGITPVSGKITFTVDGDQPEQVVPVVYTDQGGANTRLNIDDTGRPTEPFGVGGRIRYLGAEAAAGSRTVTVQSVTAERDAFVGNDDRTYFFDANDTYQEGGTSITRDQFSGLLSPGDVLSVTYDPDDADTSLFNVTTDDVDPPSVPTTTVVNADGGATANDVRVTYVRPATSSPGTTYTLQRALAVAGDDEVCGTTDDELGTPPTFLTISSATQAPGDGVRTFVFSDRNVPDGCYIYRVVATSPVSGANSSAQAASGTRVPAPRDTTAPTSTSAAITTSAGEADEVDAGDVIKIVFSEPLATPADNASIQVSDGPAGGLTSAAITAGVNATFALNASPEAVGAVLQPAGTVLTITLVNDPVESPSLVAGVQRPATITGSSGITDRSGNAWNIGGSADDEI